MRQKTINKIREIVNEMIPVRFIGNRLTMPLGGGGSDISQYIKSFNAVEVGNVYTLKWIDQDNTETSADIDLNDIYARMELAEETLTELTPKVERALLTPLPTVTETELVGISNGSTNANEQVRIKIGDGLEFDETTKEIKTSANLYRHNIKVTIVHTDTTCYLFTKIINNNSSSVDNFDNFLSITSAYPITDLDCNILLNVEGYIPSETEHLIQKIVSLQFRRMTTEQTRYQLYTLIQSQFNSNELKFKNVAINEYSTVTVSDTVEQLI